MRRTTCTLNDAPESAETIGALGNNARLKGETIGSHSLHDDSSSRFRGMASQEAKAERLIIVGTSALDAVGTQALQPASAAEPAQPGASPSFN